MYCLEDKNDFLFIYFLFLYLKLAEQLWDWDKDFSVREYYSIFIQEI